MNISREFAKVENIRLVCLLDLTADFWSLKKMQVDADLLAAREEQNW